MTKSSRSHHEREGQILTWQRGPDPNMAERARSQHGREGQILTWQRGPDPNMAEEGQILT